MNNNQQSTISNPQSLRDALWGLYLLADLFRNDPQFMTWEAGLCIGLVVGGDVHRLHLSRRGKAPTPADWDALLDAMPYHLRAEPTARNHGELRVLEATYRIRVCGCGYPRALVAGMLQACARCGAEAAYWKRETAEVRL